MRIKVSRSAVIFIPQLTTITTPGGRKYKGPTLETTVLVAFPTLCSCGSILLSPV